ncbi:MAG: hypothetical protein AAFX05_13525 [Planctomycetota bacterium]
MNPTSRDKVLIALLPAILIIALYGWGFNRSLQREIDGLQSQLEDSSEKPVTDLDVRSEQARASSLAREMADLQERREGLERELDGVARPLANTSGGTAQSQDLTALLSRHGLQTIRQQPATGRSLGELAPVLAATAKRLEKRVGALDRQLVRVEVSGRYSEVVDALTEMGSADSSIIGVSLEMADAPIGTEVRTWTLVVWM